MADTQHVVKQGDCMASLGFEYGFHWKMIWDHPPNAQLKDKRQDPNVLFPGDIVTIPQKRPRLETGATEQRHRFQLKGVPATLRMKFLDQFGSPRADLDYELFLVDGKSRQGKTNAEGEMSLNIPPNLREARLFIGLGDERQEVMLRTGDLDPPEEISGIQARLANLGYDPGPVDGRAGPRTQQALRDFQESRDLEVTGELDDPTLLKLKEIHGH